MKYYVYMYLDGQYQKCAILSDNSGTYRLAYGHQYLKRPDRVAIDPFNLPLIEKEFESETVFGAIKDSAPDRWGRYLLEKRFGRGLSEIEYILANGIDHVGALGFSPVEYDTPMRLTQTGYVPHSLDRIELKLIMEQTEFALKHEEDLEKFKELLTYGPSLGGARPKYSVYLNKDSYLAKYGVSLDKRREPLIEYATMSLARDLGLNVPQIRKNTMSGRDVFYIRRFDRQGDERFPFISSLSLCQWDENDYASWSYPVFCEFLKKIGKNEKLIKQDLRELFRRVAFNIAVNNDDDHPRNHGILYKDRIWRLSPLYDVVPKDAVTQSFSLAMEVGVQRRIASKNNLLSAASYFELEQIEAEQLIDEVNEFVATNWEGYFQKAGLSEIEVESFRNAMKLK